MAKTHGILTIEPWTLYGECMATKRLKDGAWRFRVTRSKVLPRPVYFTFENEADGDVYCAKLEQMLDGGIIPDGLLNSDAKRLGTLLHEYGVCNSVKPDDGHLLRLIGKQFHDLEIKSITYTWAERWLGEMKRERNLAPGTIRHYMGALARCLDWAVAKDYLPLNPLRLLPKGYAQYTEADSKLVTPRFDREMDRRIEEGEEAAIRAQFRDPELLLLFELALETGMRLSEIYPLDWVQVDLQRNTIFLDKTKNGQKRQVPLSSVAHKVLAGQEDQSGPLFEWGGKSRKTSAMLSKRFARLFERAGAEGFRFHCLRHEAASRLFERTDLSEFEIMKILGHSDVKILARYANLRGANLAKRLW